MIELACAMILCQLEPFSAEGWHYRTKVGGRPERCWYQGERMLPRKQLYWAETPAIPMLKNIEVEPGEFELRWKGEMK